MQHANRLADGGVDVGVRANGKAFTRGAQECGAVGQVLAVASDERIAHVCVKEFVACAGCQEHEPRMLAARLQREEATDSAIMRIFNHIRGLRAKAVAKVQVDDVVWAKVPRPFPSDRLLISYFPAQK